jgi:hypothetical protein
VKPSVLPGIWMSVKSGAMSERLSSMATASSAFAASTAINPASATTFAAHIRNVASSSTAKTADTEKGSAQRQDYLTLS